MNSPPQTHAESRTATGARLAGWLWLGGSIGLVRWVLAETERSGRAGTAVVAVAALSLSWLWPRLRWSRTPEWALPWSFTLTTLAVLAGHALLVGATPPNHAAFLVLVFAWVGSVGRRGTALALGVPAAVALFVMSSATSPVVDAIRSVLQVVPILIAAGEGIAWAVARRDELASALRHSEQRLAALIAASADLIAVMDGDGRIQFVSPSAERVAGYTPDAITGQRLIELVHPDDRAVVTAAFRGEIEPDGTVGPIRTRIRHSDGHWVQVETTATDRRDDPAIGGWVLNSHDVTANETYRRDLSRAAAELSAANEELRKAARLKDEFVSTTSHELRTPLTSILGFAMTLEQRGAAMPPERTQELGSVIARNAHRLDNLVEDLLTMSRILSHRLQPDPVDIRLADAVGNALETIWSSVGGSIVDIDDSLVIFADIDHAERMIINLLTNAHKYGRPPVSCRGRRVGDMIEIVVEDTGDGVPPEFVPLLFDRFTQADSGLRRTTKGLGLGLSIVRALALANGGHVEYEPVEPHGARFVLTLPAAAVTAGSVRNLAPVQSPA